MMSPEVTYHSQLFSVEALQPELLTVIYFSCHVQPVPPRLRDTLPTTFLGHHGGLQFATLACAFCPELVGRSLYSTNHESFGDLG